MKKQSKKSLITEKMFRFAEDNFTVQITRYYEHEYDMRAKYRLEISSSRHLMILHTNTFKKLKDAMTKFKSYDFNKIYKLYVEKGYHHINTYDNNSNYLDKFTPSYKQKILQESIYINKL